MTRDDLFGLDRERRIKESRVREVFTPHQPVRSEALFFGRQAQVQRLIEHINTPGQHALLYGDRGVGKSSLANVAATILFKHLIQGELYVKRCDSSTTFVDLIEEPLRAAGVQLTLSERTSTTTSGGSAGLKIPVAQAGITTGSSTSEKHILNRVTVSATQAAEALKTSRGLLIVDEADALPSADDKKKLAELIKLLSDNGSPFKLLVVGIAATAEQLTGGHPSVQRCLKETHLGRMADIELEEIVRGGASELGLQFDPAVVAQIVKLSAGYPHFTHLLALKCAEEAIADNRSDISVVDLDRAMATALEDAEGSLSRVYEKATRSHGTDMYRAIVVGAASIPGTEFTAEQLREATAIVTGQAVTQNTINNYLTRLVSDGSGTILRRLTKGVYAFNDPRMPSYVKIAQGATKKLPGAS